MTVRDRDRGAAALMRRLRKADMVISAGVVGPAADRQHSRANMTVGELAAIHELGLGVPRRSFVRDPIDRRARAIQRVMHSELVAVARGKPTEVAAAAIGEAMAEVMRDAVDAGVPPPLAPETIRRKGHDWQLVETGQLRAAIGHEEKVGSGRR